MWSEAGGLPQIGCSHLTNLHFAWIWQQSSQCITSRVRIQLRQSYIFILSFQLCDLYRLHKEWQMFQVSWFPPPQTPLGWVSVTPFVQGPQKDLQRWGDVQNCRNKAIKELQWWGHFMVSEGCQKEECGKHLKQQAIQDLNENAPISSETSCSPAPSRGGELERHPDWV